MLLAPFFLNSGASGYESCQQWGRGYFSNGWNILIIQFVKDIRVPTNWGKSDDVVNFFYLLFKFLEIILREGPDYG